MSPERSGGKGTYMLDRIFPGLGRIRRASGTLEKRTHQTLNQMLSQLWAAGRTDVLTAIRDGELHPLEVWGQMRTGGAVSMPAPHDVEPFDPADWVKGYECSTRHRANLQLCFARLKEECGTLTLGQLPQGVEEFRTILAKKPTMFNRTRSAVQAYLRDRFGRHHPLWMGVANVPLLKERKKEGNPQAPAQLQELARIMGESYGAMAWSMALTGMGPAEYWGKWRVVTGAVEISGTKTAGRKRHVPLLGDLVRPTTTYKPFREALAAASGDRVTPYDMRRSFAVWNEHAGVEWTHIRLYLGHRAASVTDRYLWREVMQHIPADGKKVRSWLARALRAQKQA